MTQCLIIAVSICLLSACTPKVTDLKKSPSFTKDSLLSGELVIGGMVSLEESWETSQQKPYLQLLNELLLEEYPKLLIAPTEQLREVLTETRYASMLEHYKQHQKIKGAALKYLGGFPQLPQYMVLIYVKRNQVEQTRKEQQEKNEAGRATGYREMLVQSTRRMKVQFHVYDLKKQRVVWQGMLDETKHMKDSYIKEGSLQTALREAISSTDTAPTDDELYPYPEPPTTEKVLKSTFETFIDHLL